MGNIPDTIIDTLCGFFKQILEKMMIEERSSYLENNLETKANGFYERKILSIFGEVSNIHIPRSRDSQFRSSLLPSGQADSNLESLIFQMFKNGLSTRKIEEILQNGFGVSLSHATIARLSTVAYDEVERWKNRPLPSDCAVIFIDAFYFPLKRNTVENEAIYVATAINPEGKREVLCFWIPGGAEGAFNWEEILNNIRLRGVVNVEFVVADGLTGISGAISKVFPQAKYQYCVLHACRSTLNKVRAIDKKEISSNLKEIYHAENKEKAKISLDKFINRWKIQYPKVTIFWEKAFENITAFMVLPNMLWRYVYTTNCLERLHKEIKRRIKSMEQFQNEYSAEKILYMLYNEQNKRYLTNGVNGWKELYKNYREKNLNLSLQEKKI